ncbi:MAG: carbon-nitrogen hydrolase family protein [Anaerolinea sp.]|nr:carbon-nitrogen hydrolase family protein [Anaerolinea sp.]
MSHPLTVAAIQMDANPAGRESRLQKAETLVRAAASAGARLIVLPELFNVGYTYADSNYERAEPFNGPTVTWMRRLATLLNVHLAGSLLLLHEDEVYNALLLLAPDGRYWRYDKIYPWGWERAYFRNGRDITVARTDLGDIGMLICWDSAHTDLWQRYAGQVDLMLIASCPPQVSNPTYHFANGATLTFDEMGPLLRSIKGADRAVFGEMINEQAAWLGVPVINSVGCGHIETHLPNAKGSLLAMALLSPRLLPHLSQAEEVVMACDMTPGCKVVDGDGRILAQRSQAEGDGFALAAVTLAGQRPQPTVPQPVTRAPLLSYFISDVALPLLTAPVYRQGVRRAWGERMAPFTATARWAAAGVGLGTAVVFALGYIFGRARR